MRLIDADELIRIAREDKAVIGALADIKDIVDIVDAVPTIEAEPVKHGKWEPISLYCNHANEFQCSVCKESVFYDHYTRFCDYNYCPNCGAKMRGGDEK